MMLVQVMFTLALEWGEASSNPVALVRKPRQGRQRAIDVMDPTLVERVRHCSWTGATCSARRSSVSWRTRACARAKRLRSNGGTFATTPSWSSKPPHAAGSSCRRPAASTAPSTYWRRCGDDLTEWFAARGTDDPDARLFARDDGEWFKTDDWNNWRNRHFYEALDALDITRRRPYDLRHSFVSLMIREGQLTIVELAEQLGHAATETLKTYAHVFAEYRRQRRVPAVELIAEARETARA